MWYDSQGQERKVVIIGMSWVCVCVWGGEMEAGERREILRTNVLHLCEANRKRAMTQKVTCFSAHQRSGMDEVCQQ